ncbi:dihydroxyacetone kinase [Sporanaerobium hydrogeniformans]|uniref:Dihydroxyacetone kinase n=1 Tax=Sporanaerobium hydrogeniformans TaxID=3072179 RepID=A0AC61DGV8_9FIRM|nr:DAK2 domain-containing protein [Sporanaerobium hydrogeniformans]PHV71812.1 dihydroxyacetone kinase [Sporanaerobium hydrogeniformans]
MKIEAIDAKALQAMIVAGARELDEKKQMVNEMNVFPVPDGDTGTNMSLTMMAAAKEVEKLDPISAEEIAKAAAVGSLRGARGNSGVILSQLIRGFSRGIAEQSVIDTIVLANSFQKGVDTAYKAVMKPKEGTILTVAREIATKALELSLETSDMEAFIKEVLKHGYEVLHKTPDMLPVLKEAGVVDAGGQGLLCILEGAARVIVENLQVEIKKPETKPNVSAFTALKNFNTEDITFGYCTEFIVERELSKPYNEEETKAYLDSIGDSIVVVSDEQYIKVHVHTDNPGLALQKGLEFGALFTVKIENMRTQHSTILNESKEEKAQIEQPRKELAFVSVAAGSGIAEIMTSLGVDEVIEGGQTMNPSTEDILEAIARCHAQNVIVLPNNKNIILAAEQAARIEEKSKVYVVPTTTMPQGISAMIAHEPDAEDIEAVVEGMKEAMSFVQTGQITIAVRDTVIDGQDIKEGDYLGLLEGKIVVNHPDLKETFSLLLQAMKEDAEVITLYYGEDITKEGAEEYKTLAESQFADADVEVYAGKQPVYYFMISAE